MKNKATAAGREVIQQSSDKLINRLQIPENQMKSDFLPIIKLSRYPYSRCRTVKIESKKVSIISLDPFSRK